MPKIKAAVAHEFGKPLKVEDVILRSPVNNEVEVTLGAVAICHYLLHGGSMGWFFTSSLWA